MSNGYAVPLYRPRMKATCLWSHDHAGSPSWFGVVVRRVTFAPVASMVYTSDEPVRYEVKRIREVPIVAGAGVGDATDRASTPAGASDEDAPSFGAKVSSVPQAPNARAAAAARRPAYRRRPRPASEQGSEVIVVSWDPAVPVG